MLLKIGLVVGLKRHGARRGGGRGLARHGTSIRWARLIARMFGHGHRAVCSGGCQFEVLEERVLADSWSIIRANQIQPILSQIIDSCFYFPERFRDFSCWKFPQELQLLQLKTSYHLYWLFGQKFPRNAKNEWMVWSLSEVELLQFLTLNLCGFEPRLEAESR